MIETIKYFKRRKWWKLIVAAIFASGFINLKDGPNGYKPIRLLCGKKELNIYDLWPSEVIKEKFWSYIFVCLV